MTGTPGFRRPRAGTRSADTDSHRESHRRNARTVRARAPARTAPAHAASAAVARRGDAARAAPHGDRRRPRPRAPAHGLLRCEIPRVIEIEIRDLARQRLGIGEPRTLIRRGMARNRRSLEYDLAHRRGPQIGRAGRALGLAEIHRERQASVTVILDGIDFTEPHRHRQAALQTRIRLSVTRAARARIAERAGDHFLELADT